MDAIDRRTNMLWELRLTTFRGVSVGAAHYYANLTDGCYRVNVQRVIDEALARELSEKDSWDWRVGEATDRFDAKEDATAAAIAVFALLAGEGDCLVTEELWNPGSGIWLAGASRTDQTDFEWDSTVQLHERENLNLYPRDVPTMLHDGEWVVAERYARHGIYR